MNIIKKISLVCLIIMTGNSIINAQEVKTTDISKTDDKEAGYSIMIADYNGKTEKIKPDFQPDFKGGQAALNLFISKNLKYPPKAVDNNIQGVLVVKLDISKDGTPKLNEFIRKLGYGCEEEVQRLIKKMPKWNPASLNGKPIDFDYTLRVTFKLTS